MFLPWGKHHCQHLPMGIYQALGIFQAIMLQLFHHMEDIDVFFNDNNIFTNGWNLDEEHH